MSERRFETTAAFRELMDLVRDSDAALSGAASTSPTSSRESCRSSRTARRRWRSISL